MPTPGAVTIPVTSCGDVFPAGTTVSIYLASARRAQGGPPAGVAVTTATMDQANGLVLTGLTDGVRYVASANVAGVDRYLPFTCNQGFTAGLPWKSRLAARRAALGTS